MLFWRGRLILEKLQQGGVLIFDELDNSLHPKLVRLLVLLFTNPRSNPKNAQLIFATHEVTLLDRDLFRTDQIWFTEKNQFGETQLFSAQDFDGVREDVPFDKWYMAGKFGGLPKFEDIETIFNHA
jgi:AAA15 family ATPase/GTPase